MRRLIASVAVAAGFLGILLLVLLAVAMGVALRDDPAPPEVVHIAAPMSTARVLWGLRGDATIDAVDPYAATTSLGFIHGWQHVWKMALLRQAATGRLVEWFGDQAIAADILTHRLGLAQLGRASVDTLPAEDRRHLEAYARGVNAAWSHPDIYRRSQLLMLDERLSPWLAWHTLAVERLFAYLSAEITCGEATEICTQHQALENLIHVHSFEGSLAWVVRHGGAATVFHRIVFGSSALPVLQAVRLVEQGVPTLNGITLVGTPFFVNGQSRARSWNVLLSSEATVEHAVLRDYTTTYERFTSQQGSESIASIQRAPGQLLLNATTDSSGFVLSWPGLAAGSDISAWRALREGRPARFRLLSPTVLEVDSLGQWQVAGTPPVLMESAAGVLVSHHRWAGYLPPVDSTWLSAREWFSDVRSAYAASVVPAIVRALSSDGYAYPADLDSALTYLRNWDFRFSRNSIGATLFDALTRVAHGDFTDRLRTDSVTAVQLRAHLEDAVQTLSTRLGADQRMWRWGYVNPDMRHFATTYLSAVGDFNQYAPLTWLGEGHPTAPSWLATTASGAPPPSAKLEIWHSGRWSGDYEVRRRPSFSRGLFRRPTVLGVYDLVYAVPTPEVHVTVLTGR